MFKPSTSQVLMAGKVVVFAGAAGLAWAGKLSPEMLQLAETMIIALALPHAAELLSNRPKSVAAVAADVVDEVKEIKDSGK